MSHLPAAAEPSSAAPNRTNTDQLLVFTFGLFFFFGGITSLNDVLIPKLKALYTLSYAEVMLVQSAFFAAYLTVSMPATAVVKKIGYMRAAVVGLLTMAFGCLLFWPAAEVGEFSAFLGALFVLAAGITTVQVVANPLVSMLGNPHTAHSRLTFAQAFNSLGTTIFPYVGAIVILGSLATTGGEALQGEALRAFRSEATRVIVDAYLVLAAALCILAWLVWSRRHKLVETPARELHLMRAFDLLQRPRFAYGALCIFLYVGAEVAIGSLIVNYLMQSDVLGLDHEKAGMHVPLYWGGAMVGRFIGAYLLRVFSPGKVLATVATGSIALLLLAATSTGALSGYALLAIGLCNSIMFPTIFSLACEGLGTRAADGSGIICVAIVGGAVVPPLTGLAADLLGLRLSLWVPALCYALIVGFGLYARHPAPLAAEEPVPAS